MPKAGTIGAVSLGFLLVACGVAILAYFANLITMWETLPLIAILSGIWMLILAGVGSTSKSKYGMDPFFVGGWGAVLLGGGLSWLLLARISYIAAIASFLIILGIIGAVAGTRA